MTERGKLVKALARQMKREFRNNEWKGGWDDIEPTALSREVLYHAAKLDLAVEARDLDAVRELTADVANCAAIVADKMGVLDRSPQEEHRRYGVGSTDLKFDVSLWQRELRSTHGLIQWTVGHVTGRIPRSTHPVHRTK